MAVLPFVSAATVCERVLHEKDNVLSVIRMVDTFFIETPPQPVGEPAPVLVVLGLQLTLLISLKAGDVPSGSYPVQLALRKPTGETKILPNDWMVVFAEGPESGA